MLPALPLPEHPIEKTEETYGDYIDKYTMRQAIKDGVTLEIVYEGRTHNAEVDETKGMELMPCLKMCSATTI
jgi:type I site-specific restriction-modification system R (restriction) subunit